MSINERDCESESTENFLVEYGVVLNAIQLREDKDSDREPESTENFLAKYKVDSNSVRLAKVLDIYEKVYDGKHRRTSRAFVLRLVSSISTIITVVLLGLLTLSGLPESNKFRLEFTERLQFGILGAGILNYLALYYVIVSDLFPDGKAPKETNFSFEDDEEDR